MMRILSGDPIDPIPPQPPSPSQIFVQLLMIARWLTDWLMAAKFWQLLSNLQLIIVYWWLRNDWLIDWWLQNNWLMIQNQCFGFADDYFQIFVQWLIIAKAGASPGWIGPTNYQLSKKKPNLIIFQRNWTELVGYCKLGWGKWTNILLKRKDLTSTVLTVYLYL